MDTTFKSDEFIVYLQPKHNSMTQRIVGAEALVRWNHPTRGILTPDLFLDDFKKRGLISRLDYHVWEQTCKILARWQAEKRNMVPISVNVTMDDIKFFDISAVFDDLVSTYQLDPKLLEIEITESILVQARRLVTPLVSKLRAQGFTVLIDDFGSGYSSLGMLKDIQVDILKLDMSLINFGAENYERGMSVLSAVTEMAHRLDLPLIVEGVENEDQVFALQGLDCLYVQGFFFRKPLPTSKLEEMLAQKNVPEYWDLKLDYAQRNIEVMDNIRVDNISALTLRSFNIMAQSLLLNSLINLETGLVHIAHATPEFTHISSGTSVEFESFCTFMYQHNIIHPEDAEHVRRYLELPRIKERAYSNHTPLCYKLRLMFEDKYQHVTIDFVPDQTCSPENPWCVISVHKDAQEIS